MARLAERLTGHHTIGLDSAVFIYHLEAHPRYARFTRELLDGLSRQRWRGVTSTLTLMELTVRPWQLQRGDVAASYEALLVNFPNLTVAEVSREVARRAAQLRARFRIGSADALQVGTALVHEATAFVTNDRGLARLGSELEVILLDDLTAS